MPSREFVERVLGTGRADIPEPEDEVEVETPASEPEEEPEEGVEAPEEETEEVVPEEDETEDQDQPPEEPEPVAAEAQGEEFYLGRYKTREEAEAGWLEKEQMISRQGNEISEMRQQMAELAGYVQGIQQQPAAEGEFEAWAQQKFESGDAWGGASEVLDASIQSGDPIYVDSYIEQWKEVDPYEAVRFRTMVDQQIAEAQAQARAQNTPPPPQAVLNGVWVEMAQEDPDLANPEIAKQIGAVLRDNLALKGAATSGHPDAVRAAIVAARDGYRMQAARTGNGTPRKMRSSDAERLQQDKLAATVTTGDSAPNRRESTPEVPAELQEMVQRIAAGEGGFPKLRE